MTLKVQQRAGERAASDSEVFYHRAAIDLTFDNDATSDEDCESMGVEQTRRMLEQHSDFRQVKAVGA